MRTDDNGIIARRLLVPQAEARIKIDDAILQNPFLTSLVVNYLTGCVVKPRVRSSQAIACIIGRIEFTPFHCPVNKFLDAEALNGYMTTAAEGKEQILMTKL